MSRSIDPRSGTRQAGIPILHQSPGIRVTRRVQINVGMYIGDGYFIQAPHTGDVVKISSLSEPWFAATYVGARRIL